MRVACVDDDIALAKLEAEYLDSLGCSATVFSEPAKCLQALAKDRFDIIITDLRMPVMDGVQLLTAAKKISPATEVIIVTGDADKKAAIEAVKLGAFDFFEKPVQGDELIASIKRTIRYTTLLRDRDRMAAQLAFVSDREARRWGIDAFIGESAAIRRVVADIRLLQKNDRTTVLVTGESGTGKELVARAIHTGGRRILKPFVPVNCAAIPDSLAESILFGHVKGAFTGATSDKKGAFDLAHEGTLFLDEIGDMLPAIQTKLLRVIEDGLVYPVGSAAGRKVDARIIAATNANLERKVAAGGFRSDLYHRLAAFRIEIPPLRERAEDIPLLCRHFMEQLSSEMGHPPRHLGAAVLERLQSYAFPGNVRELKNIIEQALIRSPDGEIACEHIRFMESIRPPAENLTAAKPASAPPPEDFPLNLKKLEQIAVRKAAEQAKGNMAAAARLLGIGRTKLYRLLDDMKTVSDK